MLSPKKAVGSHSAMFEILEKLDFEMRPSPIPEFENCIVGGAVAGSSSVGRSLILLRRSDCVSHGVIQTIAKHQVVGVFGKQICGQMLKL